jgi:hypothetical protein
MNLHLQAQIKFVNQDSFYMKITQDIQCDFLVTADNTRGNMVTLIRTKKEVKCACVMTENNQSDNVEIIHLQYTPNYPC